MMVLYDFKYQNVWGFLIMESVILCQFVYQVQAMWKHEMNRWTWHHAKCLPTAQEGRKQTLWASELCLWLCVSAHKRTCETCFTLNCWKRMNVWHQSKFRMTITIRNWSVKTVLLGGLHMWFELWVCEDAWWLSNWYEVALTINVTNISSFELCS